MSKKYTRAEVEKHNSKDDCWIIMNNRVYDITSFLEDHPGGDDVLLERAGMDSTQSFDDIGHSKEAIAQAEDYYIGDLEGSSTSTEPKKNKYQNNNARVEPPTNWSRYLIPLIIIVVTYYISTVLKK